MYSEKDFTDIQSRIRKVLIVLLPLLAVILAAYVYALANRVAWLAYAAGVLLFIAGCYGIVDWLWPNVRYKGFLQDMQSGLSREMRGTVVEIAGQAELQDGAQVLPVRILLADEDDERIVYLNASKAADFPGPGTPVALKCYGRHIKEVERLQPSRG